MNSKKFTSGELYEIDQKIIQGIYKLPSYDGFTPSIGIRFAMMLFKKMEADHWPVEIFYDRYNGVYSGGNWCVTFGIFADAAKGGDSDADAFWREVERDRLPAAAHDDLSIAICLAALKTIPEVPNESTSPKTDEV